MKTEKQKMLDGELYTANDEELKSAHQRAVALCCKLNGGLSDDVRAEVAKQLFGKTGTNINLTQGFYCDYGSNIEVGENFY